MNRNLLIVGAGVYGLVAKEIAEDMGCFEQIDFVDDSSKTTPNGIAVVGTTKDLAELAGRYGNVIVAIGNPTFRLQMLTRIEEETLLQIVSLISPHAYVSPSAQIGRGSIIEPMAAVHTGCILSKGCLVSAGAVINHCSLLCDGVHVDCNATVAGYTMVPAGTKVCSGEVFKNQTINAADLFAEAKRAEPAQAKTIQFNVTVPQGGPVPIDGVEYNFEDGM